MPRSRNIKPAFFQNEYLAELTFEARLLFVGLWCLADKAGRLEDRPLKIKAQIFPFDDIHVDTLLCELAKSPEKFIVRYVINGARFIEIPNFLRHQNPHKAERPSEIPAFTQTLHSSCTIQAPSLHSASTAFFGTDPADSLNLIPDPLNAEQSSDGENPSQVLPEIVPAQNTVSDPVWGDGILLLTGKGTPEAQARSYLGALVKTHGKDAVTGAISKAIIEDPAEPKAYLKGILRSAVPNKPSAAKPLKREDLEIQAACERRAKRMEAMAQNGR